MRCSSPLSFHFFFLSFFFEVTILLLYWGYIVTFTKVLTIFHSLIHSLQHSLLSPSPYFSPISVSTVPIFPFSYVSTYFSTTFSLLHSFLISSLLTLVSTPRQDLFYLPVFHF
jgi:hypothetical protein